MPSLWVKWHSLHVQGLNPAKDVRVYRFPEREPHNLCPGPRSTRRLEPRQSQQLLSVPDTELPVNTAHG